MNKWISSFFFSNYFYGCCVVALSIEAGLQQGFVLNHPIYYLFIFSVSVWYYTLAYHSEKSIGAHHQRAIWYKEHAKFVQGSQMALGLMALFCTIWMLYHYFYAILSLSVPEWIMIGSFPALAALYYGSFFPSHHARTLRNIGLLKPFVIAIVWTGVVTIYPAIFRSMQSGLHFIPGDLTDWFFLKNFLFISILCILFDIKDYASDHNSQLKTIVVRFGLRKTLFLIIIPMAIISFLAFIQFTFSHHFPLLRILVNSIPFILLIMVAWSMQRRQSILYYLAIIDGLMLVKAACGIIGVLLLK